MKKILVSIFLCTTLMSGMNNNYIYIEDVNYQYIDYLINKGEVVPRFIFQQPYRLSEFENCKSSEMFEKWGYLFGMDKISVLGSTNNSYYTSKTNEYFYSITAGGHYCSENFLLGNRFSINKKYKFDEFYPGDLSESKNWLYGRVNDAYMDLLLDNFNIFVGRIKRNWGAPNLSGLIISDNPYTYDHINFAYSTKKFRFSMLYSRLEDKKFGREFMNEDSTYRDFVDVNRHIMGHRIDIHFTNNFQIALTEVAVYGGEDREFEMAFANPMTFYYGAQRNENKGMSGLWSIDLFYKPISKLSIYSQFLIDDIIVNNDPGINDRKRYPDRFAMMVSMRAGDLLINGLNLDLSYIKVWNDTYQSRRTWENYHYEGLGLGYPDVGCEEIHLKIGHWNLYPVYISNEIVVGRYGSTSISDIFLLEKREFPVKPVVNNFYNHFKINYLLSNNFTFYLQYIYLKNNDHYLNRLNVMGIHNLEFGMDMIISKSILSN